MIISIVIKIYLISVQPINMLCNAYDDQLMVELANNIINGRWLGEYNCLTLVKGVFFPLFIAFINKLHIPFLIGQELFYVLACIFVTFVMEEKIKNKNISIIIFLILLFNPITFSSELCRVYRDGVYTSLVLYLIGFTYAIFLKRKYDYKKLIKYFIGLGFTVSSMLLCREESIWIMPFLLIVTTITIIFIIKEKEVEQKIKKCSLYSIPIIIIVLTNLIVCTLNYKYYGVFQLNQYWSKEFKEAYGALTRVIPEKEIAKVPVTRETMQRIYEVSPKFKELQEYLESEIGLAWSVCGDGPYKEIQGGWIHWALIRAVESKGYYENASKANKFYEEMADEINTAIEQGKIEGLKHKRVSNVIRFDFNDIIKTIKKCKDTIKYQTTFNSVIIRVRGHFYSEEQNELWKNTTLEDINFINLYKEKEDENRINILQNIKNIYAKVNPYLFYISIINTIVIIIYFAIHPKEKYEEVLILLGLITIYICRIFIVTFTHITMYTEAINTMYLSSTYGVQILFGMLSCIFVSKIINKYLKRHYKKRIMNFIIRYSFSY